MGPEDRFRAPAGERDAFELFAEHVARSEEGVAESFEDLLTRHPHHADELRDLHEDWRRAVDDVGELPVAPPTPTLDLGGTPTPAAGMAADGELRQLLSRIALRERRPYEVQGEVARGSMGTVLRVWDADLRRSLAMKVVLGRSALARVGARPDPHVVARFLEEAQVTGQLDHPGIVPVHELGLDEQGRLYFTMKLVKGRTLHEVFRLAREGAEGWTVPRALGCVLKVCEAMAYAHAKGVIHRDLKPSNVMVGRFGEVFVMDWGLARVLGRAETKDIRVVPEHETAVLDVLDRRDEDGVPSPLLTMDGDVLGTPAYMPPEQADGRLEDLGPAADVYALGAIVYHLLTGSVPYTDGGRERSAYAVLARVLDGPPPAALELAPDTPPELAAIAEKAMARRPEDRYAGMEALAEDLRAFLEGRVVTAFDDGSLAVLRKWVARNRAATALAASVLVLLVGVAALGAWTLANVSRVEAAASEERAAVLDGLLSDGFLALWDGAVDRAAERFEAARAHDPRSALPVAGLFFAKLARGDSDGARAVLAAAPPDLAGRARLAALTPDAGPLAPPAAGARPAFEEHGVAGLALLAQGRAAEAADLLEEAALETNAEPRGFYQVAALRAAGRALGAAESLRGHRTHADAARLARLARGVLAAWPHLAGADDHVAAAFRECRRVVPLPTAHGLDPVLQVLRARAAASATDAPAQAALARGLALAGRRAEALEAFGRALALSRGATELAELAVLQLEEGALTRALETAREAVQRDRQDAAAWTALGRALAASGRFAEAEGALLSAEGRLGGADPHLTGERATMLLRSGRFAEADRALRAGLLLSDASPGSDPPYPFGSRAQEVAARLALEAHEAEWRAQALPDEPALLADQADYCADRGWWLEAARRRERLAAVAPSRAPDRAWSLGLAAAAAAGAPELDAAERARWTRLAVEELRGALAGWSRARGTGDPAVPAAHLRAALDAPLVDPRLSSLREPFPADLPAPERAACREFAAWVAETAAEEGAR